MYKFKTYCLSTTLLLVSQLLFTSAMAEQPFSPYVDNKGNISFPQDFTVNMVHLGSWYVPDGAASGFHGVYSEKESVDAFRQTGLFPDGATLVKELRPSLSGDYTTGKAVSHATADIKQWFVMIKDSKARFADNPNWGDGWGWALYKPDNPAKNVSTDYRKDCLGCHLPVKESDLVYSEAYPLLIR